MFILAQSSAVAEITELTDAFRSCRSRTLGKVASDDRLRCRCGPIHFQPWAAFRTKNPLGAAMSLA